MPWLPFVSPTAVFLHGILQEIHTKLVTVHIDNMNTKADKGAVASY